MNEPRLRKREEIKASLGMTSRLQTLPQSTQKILNLLSAHAFTAQDVAREIEKDFTLSSQMLKLINSGFYGFAEPVKSITHATVLLGCNTIRTLVTGTSMVSMFTDSFEGLWTHSLACARACSGLTRVLRADNPEEISVVGLLHDIGKVILQQYFQNEFRVIADTAKSGNRLMVEAEQMVIETTHAEIARWVLEKWRLSEDVFQPIGDHHALKLDSPFARRTSILHLADILVRAIGCGSGGDNGMPAVNHDALAILAVKESDVRDIMGALFADLDEFIW